MTKHPKVNFKESYFKSENNDTNFDVIYIVELGALDRPLPINTGLSKSAFKGGK